MANQRMASQRMASAEELERKLQSHAELRSIVKTMKALSAASIRQYEHAAQALGDYYRTVDLGLRAVLGRTDPLAVPARVPKGATAVVVVIGSDHGLCGRVNEEVAQLACARLSALRTHGGELCTMAVGARMPPLLESAGWPVRSLIEAPGSAARIKTVVQEILLTVDAWRAHSDLASLAVVYAHHRGATAYRPVYRLLFPIDPARFRERRARPWPGRSRPLYTVAGERLLGSLVQQMLFVSLFRACAESQASEHGSRLAAMTAAEHNLDDRIAEVTAEFRRVRQGAITAELLDVVAGYEALGGASTDR
ncbi:MAG: F0F1 ATP synthase subunit gamma [Gammaproteobacteria bacterium]